MREEQVVHPAAAYYAAQRKAVSGSSVYKVLAESHVFLFGMQDTRKQSARVTRTSVLPIHPLRRRQRARHPIHRIS